MLRAIVISIVSALLYTAIAAILNIVFLKDFKIKNKWIIRNIRLFAVRFLWTLLFMYFSCNPFIVTTGLVWMWIPELFVVILSIPITNKKSELFNYKVCLSMCVVSLLACIVVYFAPTQEIVNVNDLDDSKISNSESVEFVLNQFQKTVGNDYDSPSFSVENSGMRRINDEDVLVYHVSDNGDEHHVKYIPGYIIQKDGKSPEVIQKRIYFDKSFKFEKYALRAVRKKYSTEIIGKSMFDIDDEYNPYEVFVYRENLFFSDGNDYGVIVIDLNDGTSEKYSESSGEVPKWVDFKSTYPR